MRANEAPEKIYLTKLMLFAAPTISGSDNDIEYIRTDAFINKAIKWIIFNTATVHYANYEKREFLKDNLDDIVEDFRKAMEE